MLKKILKKWKRGRRYRKGLTGDLGKVVAEKLARNFEKNIVEALGGENDFIVNATSSSTSAMPSDIYAHLAKMEKELSHKPFTDVLVMTRAIELQVLNSQRQDAQQARLESFKFCGIPYESYPDEYLVYCRVLELVKQKKNVVWIC